MRKLLLTAFLAVLMVAGCSSSKTSPTPTSPGSTTAPTGATNVPAGTVAAPSPTRPAGGQLSDLSIVYIDTRAPGQAQVWLAAADGTKPKQVATLQQGAHSLDLNYNLLVANTGIAGTYQVVDLATAQVRSVTANTTPTDARLLDANTLLYATRIGCGPSTAQSSLLNSVDLKTMQEKTLLKLPTAGFTIISVDAKAGTVVLAPRGCDVSTTETRTYVLADGALFRTVATMGCGWVLSSDTVKKVLASWRSCTVPASHADADATLYDYSVVPAVGKDVKAPAGGANTQPFLLHPNQAQAALGTLMTVPGPGGTTGSGIWLLDLATATFSQVQPAAGAEQYPIAWSANGAYLLTATVQAQGVCSFSVIEIAAKKVMPVLADISQCGVNGQVVGFADVKR